MTHILGLNQDLEEMKEKLSSILGRPVYIASCLKSSGTHYRKPNSSKYIKISPLDLYLSQWTDNGLCVKRETP